MKIPDRPMFEETKEQKIDAETNVFVDDEFLSDQEY